eukprot:contig_30969_g7574
MNGVAATTMGHTLPDMGVASQSLADLTLVTDTSTLRQVAEKLTRHNNEVPSEIAKMTDMELKGFLN